MNKTSTSTCEETPNEPLAVEARFTASGEVTPLAFVWRGQRWIVNAWGRRWTESHGQGSIHCFLVQTTVGGTTFELAYDPTTTIWRLRRAWLRMPAA